MGPSYPKAITGFICCDEVQYKAFAKDEDEATAEFFSDNPQPKPKERPYQHDNHRGLCYESARHVLEQERKLDGWALDSSVESITFGTPAGISAIGVAVIRYLVKF